jgi:aminopeptidase-like protein
MTMESDIGKELYRLVEELYPLCRSITGNGVRETLTILQSHIPLTIHEVPSGTQVFDWQVPKEWNICDAYIKNRRGERVIDFRQSNLHVVGYSIPIRQTLSLDELKPHVYTLPDHPDWIPYRTSYYKEDWGFCLTHHQWLSLQDEEYEVCIDSSLEEGALTYGELYLPGQTEDDVLFSCHVCHPSLCNDNLSGIAVVTWLAKFLMGLDRRYSYRMVFLPGTIGPITWLSLNESLVSRIKHGLVVALVGDPGVSTYKRSRNGQAEIDRAVAHVLRHAGNDFQIRDFLPYGYDERQYCSPGFNLPVGCFMRTPNGCFPEYHTSADNLDFVQPPYLADSYEKLQMVVETLEGNATYLNLNPKCEPQLGKRGLYRTLSGQAERGQREMAMFWVLNLSDGTHSLLDIAERADMPFALIKETADLLEEAGLLEPCSP